MEKELLIELKETKYQLDQYRLLTNKLINQNVSQYNMDKFIEEEYIQTTYKNIYDYEYDLYNWLSPDLLDEVSNELIRLQSQLKKQKEIINRTIDAIDLVIELIKQQPTEDDSWILNRLNGFKFILEDKDKTDINVEEV